MNWTVRMETLERHPRHSTDSVELRQFVRYPLDASANFLWVDPHGSPHGGEGVIRDISAGGVFLFTPTPPPAGSLVRMRIAFPMLPDAVSGMRMESEGRVLRVEAPESAEQITGFAALTESFFLQEQEQD